MKDTPFADLVANAAQSLALQSTPTTVLPLDLAAQIQSTVEAVKAFQVRLEREIADAGNTEIQGIRPLGRSSAIASSSQVFGQGGWSAKTFLPALQVEDVLVKMRSGNKGDGAQIQEMADWARDPQGRAPFGLHSEVLKAIGPTLDSWLALHAALGQMQSPGVGAPVKGAVEGKNAAEKKKPRV